MRTNDEVIELIKEILNQKQLSMSELARRVDMAKSAVSRYLNKTREFPLNRAEDFAKALGVSTEYLLGVSPMTDLASIYNQLESSRQAKVYEFSKKELEEQNKVINLGDYNKKDDDPRVDETLEGYLSAGTGEYLSDAIAEPIRIPKSIIPEQPYDMILQVNGDSMEPMFENGEYVFIHKTKDIRSGQIGVFIIDGESYLKKVYINDDHLRLVSLNKKYEDLIFDSINDIHLIGTVVM